MSTNQFNIDEMVARLKDKPSLPEANAAGPSTDVVELNLIKDLMNFLYEW